MTTPDRVGNRSRRSLPISKKLVSEGSRPDFVEAFVESKLMAANDSHSAAESKLMKRNSHQLSWRKRLLFQFVIIVFAYGLTELLSLAFLNFSFKFLIADRHEIARRDPETPGGKFDYSMMIHPYLGMVYQPRQGELEQGTDTPHITEFGFYDNQSPLRNRRPDRIIVGLMGGSVSRQMSLNATGVLERELLQIPEFQGKTIDFVRLAIEGNKQPQQLMTLNYLLTLGGEFDLVINLDGLNEIALPSIDNVPFGVSTVFPRKWGSITAGAASREMRQAIGYLTYLRRVQTECARWCDAIPLRYSPTAALVWKARNAHLEELVTEQVYTADRIAHQELSYCSSGPLEKFESEEQLLAHCAEIWARSSKLLHDLCQANGIRYFHFLQPNQYVTGSKPFGPKESATALNDKSPFARPATKGYPMLLAKEPELRSAGVAFADLTRIFAEHPEPIYNDDCCHVFETGDQIMAIAIAARIKASYEVQSTSKPQQNE